MSSALQRASRLAASILLSVFLLGVVLATASLSGCDDKRRQGDQDDAALADATVQDAVFEPDADSRRDGSAPDADGAACAPPDPYQGQGGEGQSLGLFQQTFYWLVLETECLAPPESPSVDIYDPDGQVLASVSQDFACKLGLEGSGKLADGRVINYWGSGSSCVRTTECAAPYYPSHNCYTELDGDRFPWGKGVRGRALIPFKSIATDPDVIPYGTIVYVPEWDGYQIPDGSFHDGCLRSDDTGGAIIDDHIDFFSGSEENYRTVVSDFPENVHVFVDPDRCPIETQWFQAVGAGCCSDDDCGYPEARCLGEPDFPGGYCSLATCNGGDCPDVGGYLAFCTDWFTGGTCVQRCQQQADCRPGYDCIEVPNLAGGTGMACVPQ